MAAGVVFYPLEPPIPSADHVHQRYFQHQGFLRALSQRKPNQEAYPNHPDADMIDCFSHYLVSIEVPGIKDVNSIQVRWLDANTLLVKGKTPGHEGLPQPGEDESEEHAHHRHYYPSKVIEERRLGTLERRFTFPSQTVEADNMTAKLEAGVLTIKIPKQHLHLAKDKGQVKIESGDAPAQNGKA